VAVTNLKEFFDYRLSIMLSIEQQSLPLLGQMGNEVEDLELREALHAHQHHTRQHVEQLRQCFRILGEHPWQVLDQVVPGIRREHDLFKSEWDSTARVLSLYDCHLDAFVEAYEIMSYLGLIELAMHLGHHECARLLAQNLRQEEWMIERIKPIHLQLGRAMP
jgi:ferritin-like metal-binding protein YciE